MKTFLRRIIYCFSPSSFSLFRGFREAVLGVVSGPMMVVLPEVMRLKVAVELVEGLMVLSADVVPEGIR
jgi:hypothetical protein